MISFFQLGLYNNDLLHPVRKWLEAIKIDNSKLAHFLCKAIPAQCPFEQVCH